MSDKRRRRRKGSGDSSGEEDENASITASDHEYESAAEDSALEESDVELDINSPTEKSKSPTSGKTVDKKVDQVSKNLEEVRIEDANLVDNDDGVLEMHSDKEDDILNEDIEGDEVEDQGEDWNAQDEERGTGDGQEQKDEKVDDDEDRRNPQYIPKKGMFYEHDDRIDSGDEESKEGAEKTETETDKPRRVPRSEATEKWGHDKFLERDQIPKSKDELVSTYGYDIRNEDNAPRARRRRRYGRGPNKYDRNWEDEEAYGGRGAPKDSQGAPNAPSNAPEEQQGGRPQRGGGRYDRGDRGGGRDSNYRGQDRGGRGGGRGGARTNVRVTVNQPVKIDDKEQFPALDGKAAATESRTVQALPEKENFNNVVRGQRSEGP